MDEPRVPRLLLPRARYGELGTVRVPAKKSRCPLQARNLTDARLPCAQGQLTQDWLSIFDLEYINDVMLGGLRRASRGIQDYCERLAVRAFGCAQASDVACFDRAQGVPCLPPYFLPRPRYSGACGLPRAAGARGTLSLVYCHQPLDPWAACRPPGRPSPAPVLSP